MASGNSISGAGGSVTYKLKVPLVQGDHVVTELVFMQPKLKHMRLMDGAKGEIESMARMLGALCNLRDGLVDEIDISDLYGIGEIIENFSKKSQ